MRLPAVLLALLAVSGCSGCSPAFAPGPGEASSLLQAGGRDERLGEVSALTGCQEHGGLPDPRCTPGAVRAGVSLEEICRYGYSRSVRPPESYTEALKLSQMRAYGFAGSPREYEEDHLVALSIGGAPNDSANLWPEPRNGPNNAEEKDQLEGWAARMACSRRIPLGALQRGMAKDWVALSGNPPHSF
jgi:hypothetical protein